MRSSQWSFATMLSRCLTVKGITRGSLVVLATIFLAVITEEGFTQKRGGSDSQTPQSNSTKPADSGGVDPSRPALPAGAPRNRLPVIGKRVVPTRMDKDLRQLPLVPYAHPGFEMPELRRHPAPDTDESSSEEAPVAPFAGLRQLLLPQPTMPSLSLGFEGQDLTASGCSCSPPDTDGDVGANHFIQMVNSGAFKVWDKTGSTLLATTTLNTLWGTGGSNPCTQGEHFGDGVVFYDHVADRWVLTDFAFGTSGPNTVAPYYQCTAVSQTPNPISGGWYFYPVQVDSINPNWLGDYPKFGMWPDAYYSGYNMFCGASSCTFGGRNSFQGVQVTAYDRSKMILGQAMTPINFSLTPTDVGDSYTFLPATFRFGAPPAGRNEFFAAIDSPAVVNAFNTLTKVHLWKFHVDFTTPASSTFTGPTDVTVNGFTNAWDSTENGAIVPQSGTSSKVDTVGDRLFANLWYQNLGGTESLWATHTINDTAVAPTAVRWYQFDVTGNTVATTPVQQGDINGGGDGLYRWMPSLSLDKSGNMAIGYSVSSGSTFPSIRYNGRLTTDTLNTLGQGESTMVNGTGAFTGSTRWGDYSATSIDPSDGCTFWHTNEYMLTGSTSNWKTRVGSFKYPGCVAANDGTLTGTITDSVTSAPLSGVTVTATSGGLSNSASTNGSGVYSITVLPGIYNLTASKAGYNNGTANGLVVTLGNTTTQNFALVSNCSPVARTWIGAGAGGAGTIFNTATNWSPNGVPQPCDNLTMTITSGATITLSGDSTINNLTTSLSGANNVFRLDVGTRTLTMNGTTSANVTSGNGSTQTQFNIGASPGQIIYGGDATFAAASGVTFPMLGVGNTTGQVVFRGNATFNSGAGTSSGNTPAKVIFDAPGAQTITDNAGAAIILLGNASTEIGSANSPTVTVAGSASNFQPQGDLNVNGSSTLDLTTKTFNRSAAGGTFTLNGGTTLKLAASTGGQTGSNFPLNYTTSNLNATSTVDYNGVVAQTIFASPTYGNLKISNASTKSATAALTIGRDITIGVGATFAAGTGLTHNIGGNWSNSGAFTSGTSTVRFNGVGAQTIGGSTATAFSGLTIANTGPGTTTLNTNASVSGLLTLTTDLTIATGIVLTQTGTSTGAGDAVGIVRRTDVGASPKAFGNPNVLIANNGTATTVDVNLAKGAPGGFAAAVSRGYSIVAGAGTVTGATVRLHYLDSELNGNTEGSLTLWRAVGSPSSTWTDQGFTSRDGTNNWVELTGVGGFSEWTLAATLNAPTAVKLFDFTARENSGEVKLQWRSGYEVRNLGYNIYREQDGRRVAITPSMVAGSALIAGRQTRLTAGASYTWYDDLRPQGDSNPETENPNPKAAVTYWLEDVDLDGTRTLHGPIAPSVDTSGQTDRKALRAQLISEVSQRTGPSGVQFNGWAADSSGPAGRQTAAEMKMANAAVSGATIDPIDMQHQIAGMAGAKIGISKAGWYRVTQPELQAAGFKVGNVGNLQLFRNGRELPISVSGNGQGFGAADYVEFYGEGLESPTETAQTYYLVNGSTRGKRLSITKGGKVSAPAGPQSFAYTIERKERMIYFSSLRNGDAENFFGQIVSTTPVSGAVPVSHLDGASGGAQLQVVLQGVTSQSHLVHVLINGTDLGTVNFANLEHPNQTFAVPAAALHEGDNTVELTSLGGAADVSLVDVLRLTYTRSLIADNDGLSLSVNSQQTRRISGFSNQNVRVLDITDPNNPTELTPTVKAEDGGYAAYVEVGQASALAPHALLAFAAAGAQAASVKANNPSSWWSQTTGADYLIITTGALKTSVEPLAQMRRNQGLVVKVIDVEDLYDEFSFGTHTPQAIHELLQTAQNSWTRKPHYVLLAGDASYDPKNYFGQGLNDLVPTKLIDTALMETASDDWLADFNGDGRADLALGRLPVRTTADTNTMVNKIISYENTAIDPTRAALLVADTGFEGESSAVQSLLPAGTTVTTINRSSADDATIRNQIITGLNQGPRVTNYVGHGSNGVWTGDSLFSSEDAPGLTNTNRLSVFTLMTCFNGFFQDAWNDSLSEALLKSQGGAVAVWASTTLTEPEGQNAIDQEFYRQLFGPQRATLGDASRAAKLVTTDADVSRTWTLFGDPAMRLR